MHTCEKHGKDNRNKNKVFLQYVHGCVCLEYSLSLNDKDSEGNYTVSLLCVFAHALSNDLSYQ